MEFQNINGNWSLVDFANGFVHGLQKYEEQTSKCSTDILKVKTIIESVQKLIDDIMAGKFDITTFMALAYTIYSTAMSIEDSCHFMGLITSLIALFNPVSLIIRLVEIVVLSSWTIIPSFFRAIWGAIFGDLYSAGLNIGRIIKLVLHYEIE